MSSKDKNGAECPIAAGWVTDKSILELEDKDHKITLKYAKTSTEHVLDKGKVKKAILRKEPTEIPEMEEYLTGN